MSRFVTLAASIYPQDTLQAAVDAYSEFCSVEIYHESRRECSIEIRARDGNLESQVVNEFLNYLLDISIGKHLENT